MCPGCWSSTGATSSDVRGYCAHAPEIRARLYGPRGRRFLGFGLGLIRGSMVMLSTLIVEDNVAHRLSLLRLLAGRFPSMRIDEAEDGKEAMRHVLGRHFDLVFMDVRLP